MSIWNFVAVSTHPRQIWGRLLSCLWLSTLSFWTPLQDIIDNQYPRKPNVFSSLKRKENRAGLHKITENPFCLVYLFFPLTPFLGAKSKYLAVTLKQRSHVESFKNWLPFQNFSFANVKIWNWGELVVLIWTDEAYIPYTELLSSQIFDMLCVQSSFTELSLASSSWSAPSVPEIFQIHRKLAMYEYEVAWHKWAIFTRWFCKSGYRRLESFSKGLKPHL